MRSDRAPSVLAIVAALVVIASGVAVARVITAQTATRTLTGRVTWVDTAQARFDRDVHAGLADPAARRPGPDCVGAMSSVSLVPGQGVTVYDAAGSVVARGSLGSTGAPVATTLAGDRSCAVSFMVAGVPRATDYVVEIGTNRATYPFYALEDTGWDVELPLAPR